MIWFQFLWSFLFFISSGETPFLNDQEENFLACLNLGSICSHVEDHICDKVIQRRDEIYRGLYMSIKEAQFEGFNPMDYLHKVDNCKSVGAPLISTNNRVDFFVDEFQLPEIIKAIQEAQVSPYE